MTHLLLPLVRMVQKLGKDMSVVMTHLQGTGDGPHRRCPLPAPSPDLSNDLMLLLNAYPMPGIEELRGGGVTMNRSQDGPPCGPQSSVVV